MPKKTAEDIEGEARVRGWLRQQMAERGLSISETARRCGTSPQNMGRILTGQRGVGVGLIIRIARHMHINPTRQLLEDPPEKYRDESQPNDNGLPRR